MSRGCLRHRDAIRGLCFLCRADSGAAAKEASIAQAGTAGVAAGAGAGTCATSPSDLARRASRSAPAATPIDVDPALAIRVVQVYAIRGGRRKEALLVLRRAVKSWPSCKEMVLKDPELVAAMI